MIYLKLWSKMAPHHSAIVLATMREECVWETRNAKTICLYLSRNKHRQLSQSFQTTVIWGAQVLNHWGMRQRLWAQDVRHCCVLNSAFVQIDWLTFDKLQSQCPHSSFQIHKCNITNINDIQVTHSRRQRDWTNCQFVKTNTIYLLFIPQEQYKD